MIDQHGGRSHGVDGERLNDLIVAPEYAPLLRQHGLDGLDALFTVSPAEWLHKPGLGGWRERLRLSLDRDGQRDVFYLKRFTRPPLRAQREARRAGCSARSMAGLEWAWSRRLAAEHLPAVVAVAYGEALRGRREIRSAVLLAEVPGESLERWCAARASGLTPEDRTTLRSILAESASVVSRFHARGYVHRDMYLSHLFYHETGQIGDRLRLIDLQRIRRPGWRRVRWAVKDLAALHYSTPPSLVSRSDRLRWLIRYLSEANLRLGRRALIYRIIGKSHAMARRDRRRYARERVGGS